MRPINVMINGLPGNMAAMLINHVLSDERFNLLPYSLTGPEITVSEHHIRERTIRLIGPEDRQNDIERIKATEGDIFAVDFTHPSAVNDNAAFYCQNRIPFVMGTTGGDRQHLTDTVSASDISAVIAPNMAKQIVGFQAMMTYAADNFPGLFKDYKLEIKESHQQTKADTSGTAKAMVEYFNRLGIDFAQNEIIQVRDPDTQKNQLGVPEAYLTGHGWHTYTLISPDQTVTFKFTHNVNGRDIYAQGTFDAVDFLVQKISQGEKGRIFSMIDVLRG